MTTRYYFWVLWIALAAQRCDIFIEKSNVVVPTRVAVKLIYYQRSFRLFTFVFVDTRCLKDERFPTGLSKEIQPVSARTFRNLNSRYEKEICSFTEVINNLTEVIIKSWSETHRIKSHYKTQQHKLLLKIPTFFHHTLLQLLVGLRLNNKFNICLKFLQLKMWKFLVNFLHFPIRVANPTQSFHHTYAFLNRLLQRILCREQRKIHAESLSDWIFNL